jgi:hypothetical protein
MNDGTTADGAPTRAQSENFVTGVDCLFSTWLRLRQLSILYEADAARILADFRRFSVREAADAWREVSHKLAETVRHLEELETAIREQREGIAAMLKQTTNGNESQT